MGKIWVNFIGLNQNKFINELSENNIVIFDAEKKDYNNISLWVQKKDLKQLKLIAKKYNLQLEVLHEKNLLQLLKNNWHYVGLAVGLVLSVAIFRFATSFYWKVNVEVDSGNTQILEVVNNYLQEEGICKGQKIKALQTREIERLLMKNVENCSLAVVKQNGVELSIFIKERVVARTLLENSVIASHSGVVEKVSVKSGQLIVNVGEAVVAGEPLIVSEKVGDIFMEASGNVIASVLISGEAVGSLEKISCKPTGNCVDVCYYEVCGKKYYTGKENEESASSKYEKYEVIKEETLLTNNLIVPIKKIGLRYYEFADFCDIITYEQLIDELKKSAYNVALSNMPSGAEELSVEYSIIEDGELYKVVCNIKTTIDIAIREKNK